MSPARLTRCSRPGRQLAAINSPRACHALSAIDASPPPGVATHWPLARHRSARGRFCCRRSISCVQLNEHGARIPTLIPACCFSSLPPRRLTSDHSQSLGRSLVRSPQASFPPPRPMRITFSRTCQPPGASQQGRSPARPYTRHGAAAASERESVVFARALSPSQHCLRHSVVSPHSRKTRRIGSGLGVKTGECYLVQLESRSPPGPPAISASVASIGRAPHS